MVEIKREYGWGDKEFKSIIDEVLAEEEDVIITDVSSPPGTSKTRNTLKYAVERRKSLIASFPTHANQEQALDYIMRFLEDEKPRKLPFFVLDYAGIENYCIFYKPELLMKLLDKFKEKDTDTYKDAVENYLGNPIITSILIQRGLNIDEIWYEIGNALDEYKKTKDRGRYVKRIQEIIEKKGQYEICRGVCPVGLMFWQHRRNVYHDLSNPKIITWRNHKVKEWKKEYPLTSKHVVLANPENTVNNITDLIYGNYKLENVLCPRLLLISKSSLSRNNRPNYIPVRKSIILTPHAGLSFVLSVIRREHEIQRIPFRHLLFLDEYDTLLRPRSWKVYSLSTLSALIAVANMVLRAGIGNTVKGVYVDEYLYRYAEYVKTVSQRVFTIVNNSIKNMEYHPLVNLFIEGAMSTFRETTLKPPEEKFTYRPLSTRPVHIKYFLRDDTIPLILNEKLYFEDLAYGDPEWKINLRTAKINFSKLASNIPVNENRITYVKLRMGNRAGKQITLTRRRVKRNVHSIINDLKTYIRPLLDYPRFAVFYRMEDNSRLELNSIDIPIYGILGMKGILTSASPVLWNYIVSGPRKPLGTAGIYDSMQNDMSISTIRIVKSREEEFFDRMITLYTVKFNTYQPEDKKKIEEAISTGSPIPPIKKFLWITGTIKQISVLSSMSQEYSRLLSTIYLRKLPPLYTIPPIIKRSDKNVIWRNIRESLTSYLNIIRNYIINNKGNDELFTLLLVQNKLYARIIAHNAKALLCYKDKCGGKIEKPTHYSNKKLKLDITWFRSRAERGIDLPNNYKLVLVVGSPYPKPGYIAGDVIEPSEYTTAISEINKYYVRSFNTKRREIVSITHLPLDLMAGISELTQAIGRATRSVMKTGKPVKVLIPAFLRNKIYVYAPLWLKMESR